MNMLEIDYAPFLTKHDEWVLNTSAKTRGMLGP